MKSKLFKAWPLAAATAVLIAGMSSTAAGPSSATGYLEINLVSDNTNAAHVDARLLNPWGIVASPQTLWVNDNHSGLTMEPVPFPELT